MTTTMNQVFFVLIHKFSLTCLTTDSLFANLSSFQLTPWSLYYLQQCRNYWLAILDSLFQILSCSHFHTDQDGLFTLFDDQIHIIYQTKEISFLNFLISCSNSINSDTIAAHSTYSSLQLPSSQHTFYFPVFSAMYSGRVFKLVNHWDYLVCTHSHSSRSLYLPLAMVLSHQCRLNSFSILLINFLV